MPYFSASNMRFISSAEQLQQKCKEFKQKERAKTAYRAEHRTHSERLTFQPLRRRCEQYIGYDTKDVRRTLVERKKREKPRELILAPKELERLKNHSICNNLEERKRELERQKEENLHLATESERLRLYFKEVDDARNAKLKQEKYEQKDEQNEKMDDKAKLLNRVHLARQEQEEEIKILNRMILNAKCHAVRDAQIQEKQLLNDALKKNEEYFMRMVNIEAKKTLNQEDERERFEQQKRAEYAKDIRKQLNERESKRLLEAERIEEEAKILRKANEAIKEEEEKQRAEIKKRQQGFREEYLRLKEISNLFKKVLCEQEQLADMRIAAYMREKREKEQKLKIEQHVAKQEFERRQQHIYSLAEKAMQSKNINDESSYLKERERMEREYRRKEKDEVIRKREMEKELEEIRAKQEQEKQQRLALQIARSEEDFNKLMEHLKVEEARQKALDKERECNKAKYRRDIMQQMKDKEMERRRLMDLEKLNRKEWLEKEQQREANIKAVINAKIKDMRENCLPEKYIREVQKQLNKIQNKKNHN